MKSDPLVFRTVCDSYVADVMWRVAWVRSSADGRLYKPFLANIAVKSENMIHTLCYLTY